MGREPDEVALLAGPRWTHHPPRLATRLTLRHSNVNPDSTRDGNRLTASAGSRATSQSAPGREPRPSGRAGRFERAGPAGPARARRRPRSQSPRRNGSYISRCRASNLGEPPQRYRNPSRCPQSARAQQADGMHTPQPRSAAHALTHANALRPIVSPSIRMAVRQPRALGGPSPGRRQCARDGPATRDQRSPPGSRPGGSDAARRPRVNAWPGPPASHRVGRHPRTHA
jgi:hypothetical protein